MSRVFADTFYFLALLNQADAAHQKAVEYSKLIDRLVTSEWVLTEVADGLAVSRHRNRFGYLRRELLAEQNALVVPLNMATYQAGIDLFDNRPDKEWSLTDCISFVIMEREAIRQALTGDRHFEQAGFLALLK
ncbi:MAG: PIN domain-containing protein [Planctomycetales bacterium]|nr:PIN domain-containing protein [Planctomycetales bacterium]